MMYSSDLKYLMNLPKFEYFEPKTVEEACRLLGEYKDEARILAGGTDLVVAMKQREAAPKYIINIKPIDSLHYIRCHENGSLEIGAATTLNEIEKSRLARERFPLVALAAGMTGPPSIRNVATMAGNFCTALPSADSAPLMICLGAKVKIQGAGGVRAINLEDFFICTKKSILQNDEILTEIEAPSLPAHSAGTYIKNPERSNTDIAVAGVAAVVTMDEDRNRIIEAKIVLGAVAPTPLRAFRAEEILIGSAVSEEIITEAALAASQEASPRTRFDYKRQLVKVLTKRALTKICAQLAPPGPAGRPFRHEVGNAQPFLIKK